MKKKILLVCSLIAACIAGYLLCAGKDYACYDLEYDLEEEDIPFEDEE